MKYTVDISYYVIGQGYSHTGTVDNGTTSEYITAAEWLEGCRKNALEPDAWAVPANEWWEITVEIYNNDDDPMYDNPIYTSSCIVTANGIND